MHAPDGVHAGQTVLVELVAGRFQGLHLAFHGGQRVRDQGGDVRRGGIAQGAGRFTVFAEFHGAFHFRLEAGADAADLQSEGVGAVDVQAVAGDDQRVVRADFIQLFFGGQDFLIREFFMVEAGAQDPFALGRRFRADADQFQQFLQGVRLFQIQFQQVAGIRV